MPDHFYTVAQAGRLLGVSVPTIKRMVHHGELQSFQTPGGHLRIATASVERIRTGRAQESRGREPSSVLKNRRERVEELALETQEIRARRDLRQLHKEDAQEAERDRQEVAEEERAQRQKEDRPRREEERARIEEEQRRRDRADDAVHAHDVAEDQKRRDASVEVAITKADGALPFGARAFGTSTTWQRKVRQLARANIAKLSVAATPEEIQDAALDAAQVVTQEYEKSEVCKAQEQRRESLLQSGLNHIFFHLLGSQIQDEFEFDRGEALKLDRRLQTIVRPELLKKLQVDLDRQDVEAIVEQLVHDFLDEQFED